MARGKGVPVVFLFFLLLQLVWSEEELVEITSPENAILVFDKGEGGYFCHKIPYLFHTKAHTLIALGTPLRVILLCLKFSSHIFL
jgi:hypothetical protein